MKLSDIIIERIDYNIFETENLEKKNSITSCIFSSTDYNIKLFTVCRTQSVKKVLYNWINRSVKLAVLIYWNYQFRELINCWNQNNWFSNLTDLLYI